MTGGETVLINDWRNQFPSHSIGDLQFGPDGYLYASGGDGASFNNVDYGQFQNNPFGDPTNEGGAVRSQDMLSSGDPTNLNGTVIRVNPDTGAGAPGNPYANSSDANERRIIATGLRNPYRFSFRPGTSEIWIAETGWNTYEEINRITDSSDTSAENFGWPAYEGPNRQAAYDAANLPLIEGLYAQGTGAVTMPWFAYSHSEKVVAGTTEPIGGSSPTGVAFYNASAYPQGYSGAMFFQDYARKHIYVMYRGIDGLPDPSTRQIFRALTGSPVDLTVGPDGNVYYADLSGGRIGRLVLTSGTQTSNKLAGTVIGTSGSYNNLGNTRDKAFDGDLTNYFDAPTADGAWAGLDLTTPRWVRRISYAPRIGYASRMIGGKFQGSNDANFASGLVDLYTVTAAPAEGLLTTVNVNSNGSSFRYVRYLAPAGASGNIAEMEFYAGEGVNAVYYNNIDFTGTTATRIDPTIDFNWGSGSPDATLAADTWSVRYTGKIQAMETGTYTFRTTGDDGTKLWINGVLLIDKLVDQASTSWSNTITLAAGQLYDIRLDHYDNTGDAAIKLEWQRPGRSFEVVPATQLFNAPPSQAPVPAISTPSASLKWRVGDTITFSGSATDVEDGTLPASALSWSLVMIHGNDIDPTNTHEHLIQTFTGVASGSFVAPEHEYPSWLELRLTAKDSAGNTTTLTRRIDPQTVQIIVASNPGGAGLTFNDTAGVGPITKTWMVGASATISAPAQFVANGVTYVFSGWSDGGSLSHDIIAPATNVTYTANYAAPTPPTAPSSLTATAATSSTINLAWADNATNETSFKIERRIGTNAWSEIGTTGANVTTFADTGLAAGTTYEYRVRAASGSGDSAYSNLASATTIAIVTAPATPSDLASSSITTSSVQLAWTDNANNEGGYRVERRLTGGTFATIATLAANTTTYGDIGLAAGTGYEYRVRAFNTAGDSSASNVVTITTLSANGAPRAPGSLAAAVQAGPQVALTWTDTSTNETNFVVQRRYAGWIWGDIATVAANATGFVDTTAIGNVTYEYRVYATSGTVVSDFSNAVIVDTSQTGPVPPATPANLTAAASIGTTVNLAWQDVASDETAYKVERRLPGGTWAQIAALGANATSYADTTVTAGNTYEYRVRAANTVDSGYSSSASVTTPGGASGIPEAPSGLTAIVTTRPNTQLTWKDNSTTETAFVVQRRYSGWIWGDVATVGANVTNFLDTTGINNVTYEYRVVAISGGGTSPFSNTVLVST
jgi:titin